MTKTHIAWFRRDLRLDDNPAWAAATVDDAVVALVVVEPGLLDTAGPFRRRAFLDGLGRLDADLAERGGRLRVETGNPAEVVPAVAAAHDAASVQVNNDVSRWSTARDRRVAAALPCPLVGHWGTLVQRPGDVLTLKGTLSQVFTPFYNAWAKLPLGPPVVAGDATILADGGEGVPDHDPIEQPPFELLQTFLTHAERYPTERDLPAVAGTSELSTALRFGTISARQVARIAGTDQPGAAAFVRQLAWRDWYAHLTAQKPDIDRLALRPEYDTIPWETGPDAERAFTAWTEGRTGYPIVDAGMRQLAATGWMHNRVRMITASFLVKDLLIDWRRGERWFRHLLSDADIPQNAGNWQWVAGTGPDAAPYFRVFNPILQSKKFDSAGAYLRRWVPELAGLNDKQIHWPADVPPLDLAAAGVVLGDTYPAPIVDHFAAKEETLLAYKSALEAAREADSGK